MWPAYYPYWSGFDPACTYAALTPFFPLYGYGPCQFHW
jgi:hypothetical protein